MGLKFIKLEEIIRVAEIKFVDTGNLQKFS